MWDWKGIGNNSISAPVAESRSLALLPFEISNKGKYFTIRVTIRLVTTSTKSKIPSSFAAGFGIGRRGPLPDYRSAAVYPKSQVSAVITSKGKLSLAGKLSSSSVSLTKAPITLTLQGRKWKDKMALSLIADQLKSKITVNTVVPLKKVTGPFALITNGNGKSAENAASANVIFRNFVVMGTLLDRFNGRMLGGIMWTQYTMSENTLFLQAQLAPFDKPVLVKLVISQSEGKKVKTLSSWSDRLSRTAQFKIKNWDSQKPWWYEVQTQFMGKLHKWTGKIRQEPSPKNIFKIAAFSCDHGYLFPQNEIVDQTKILNPDLIYFAGDQMYNPTAGFGIYNFGDVEVLMLDYLRRWYLFGWTWRKLLSSRPSIILPDDHDVFHANLWGNGGTAMKKPEEKIWSAGGYIMPEPWITAVERCHTGHLPPSYANFTTPLGLKPYFTSLKYGGLSMAVLEDRKFKSAPGTFSKKDLANGNGGELLGAKQEKFLEQWVKDWSGASMKVAFSQTIFCNAATHAGKKLSRGSFYFDSGAWPLKARNRAVKLMGEGNVVTLHGDQHLGMLMQHGVEKHDDANVAFMVPGSANGFPRAWWPGVTDILNPETLNYTGSFFDDAGHPITVFAVGNPEPGSNQVDSDTISPWQLGRIKGSGYGLVELNLKSQQATFHLFRVGKGKKQFSGFPKKLFIGGAPKS